MIVLAGVALIYRVQLLHFGRSVLAAHYYNKSKELITEEKYLEAEQALKAADIIIPGHPKTNKALGDLYFYHTGEYDLARDKYSQYYIDTVLQGPPMELCMSEQYIGRYSEAEECMLKYIYIHPRDYKGYFYLGQLKYLSGDTVEALSLTEKSHKMFPTCDSVAYLIELNLIVNNIDKARSHCLAFNECPDDYLKTMPLEKDVYELCGRKPEKP